MIAELCKNAGGSIVDMGRIVGNRLRKFFKTRAEADTNAEQQRRMHEIRSHDVAEWLDANAMSLSTR